MTGPAGLDTVYVDAVRKDMLMQRMGEEDRQRGFFVLRGKPKEDTYMMHH